MTDLHYLSNLMPSSKFEMVTDTASVVAIASPWWLPVLKETSEVAAYVLPILGVMWLVTQIGWKWYREFYPKQ
jgi:hypothetical protein